MQPIAEAITSSQRTLLQPPPLAYSVAAPSVARLELERWLERMRFERSALTGHAHRSERSYVRLSAAVDCEAWLICWPPGSQAPLHDHGRAQGVAAVLSGELSERFYQRSSQLWFTRTWKQGVIVELERHTCHEVHNALAHTAHSIHVYSPRLESMTFYTPTSEGGVRPLRQEEANQW
jgi:predicted metal-dependent enzyme (double-stranded beta helix superfamily)